MSKTYTLKPQFITNLQERFRKFKLGRYKRKKVNESKTSHQRYYHMKFKIRVLDDYNPQESAINYEMVVPARAAFFAKAHLEQSILKKIAIDVVDWDEITDEEHEEFLNSKKEYAANNLKKCEHAGEQISCGKNKFHCTDCHEEYLLD